MKRKKSQEINIFSVSFLDVLANTIGGLAFLLVLAVMMVGAIVFAPPLITTETLPDGYNDIEYTVWLGAREGLGKYQWSFGKGEWPQGLKLDALTGKLYGKPGIELSAGDQKRFEFSILCQSTTEDSQKNPQIDKKDYQLIVHRQKPIDTIPLRILTGTDLPGAYLHEVYPLVFAAEGGQPPYTWTVYGNFPPGLSLTSQGRITGKAAKEGEYDFDATVRTSQGESKTQTFSLKVSKLHKPPPPPPPLQILTKSIPAALAKRTYFVWLAAQGGISPYRWTEVKGLPAWLKANSDNTGFEGEPGLLDIGDNRIIFRITDAIGNSLDSAPIELKVLPPAGKTPPPLKIKTKTLPDARVSQEYELAVAVEGGFPPYRWECQSNQGKNSQQGITFSLTGGIIHGTHGEPGRLYFPISITDAAGQKDTANFELNIQPPLTEVKILTTKVPDGRVDQQYIFELSAAGGYPPYTWNLASGTMPPGLKLDKMAGRLSGKPAEVGTWTVQFTVADAKKLAPKELLAAKILILTREGARKLVIKTQSLPTLLRGEFSNTALACEGGNEPYDWEIKSALPKGLVLTEGQITGKPSISGTYPLELLVRDSGGEIASITLPLTVKHMAPFWLIILSTILLIIVILTVLWLTRSISKRKVPEIPPLKIATGSLPNARASCEYSVQLACIGGVPPYHWRIIKGELPPGLELTKEGKIQGCPFEGIAVDKTINIPFTVEVIDSRGNKAEQKL
jgi:hypothetical protein